MPASVKILEIPLDPEGWVAKACAIVGRDLILRGEDFLYCLSEADG